MDIYAGGTTVQGLDIRGFDGNGILLAVNGNNTIQNNFIGTNESGTASSPNTQSGVAISGSGSNTVSTNVISGNGGSGVTVANDNSTLFLTQNVPNLGFTRTVTNGTASYSNTLFGFLPSGQGYTLLFPPTVIATVMFTIHTDNTVTGTYSLPPFSATLQGPGAPRTVTALASSGPITGNVTGNTLTMSYPLTVPLQGAGPGSVYTFYGFDTGTVTLNSSLSGTFQVAAESPGGRNAVLVTDISDAANNASDSDIVGNFIGTDANGTAALGNANHGVIVQLAPPTTRLAGRPPARATRSPSTPGPA